MCDDVAADSGSSGIRVGNNMCRKTRQMPKNDRDRVMSKLFSRSGACATAMRTVVLCLLVALLSLPRAVHAEDKLMRWYFNTTLGGKTFDMLQCQALTFDWDQFGDGQLHSVWRFPDEAAYDACDFRRATEERSARKSGVYTIRGADTLPVTKMWFGSREGDDCSNGQMKAVLKIRPLFQYKFPDRNCVGGTLDVEKDEDTIKECRKRAKRRRNSLAVQYDDNTGKCSIFSTVPTGISSIAAGSSCEIATTSCDPSATLSLSEPPPPPTRPPPTRPPPTPPPPTPQPPTPQPPTPAASFSTITTCASGFSARQEVGTVVNPPLDEASGIVAGFRNPTTIYSHNDLTGRPELYAIATSNTGRWNAGELQGVFKMNGAGFNDYEDIAISPSGKIFAGDIGDNSNRRNSIKIYRVSEPDLSRGSYTLMDTQVLEATYPGGSGINAECLMYDQYDDRLYIVTKSKGDIYRTPFAWGNSNAKMTLVKVGTVKTRPGSITGCDISRNGREILMKFYDEVVFYCRNPGESLASVLSGDKGEEVPYETEPQGEGVAFAGDRNGGYYTLSESKGSSRIPLYYYARE